MLSIYLLGPVRVSGASGGIPLPASRKARGLLAYLLTEPRPCHRIRLCELFWDVPNDPRGELRWCLSKLRKILDQAGTKRLKTDGDYISIDRSSLRVDALDVECSVEAALASRDLAALVRLDEAIAGDFLDGLSTERIPLFESWLVAQRERHRSWHARILAGISDLTPVGAEARIGVSRKRIALRHDDVPAHIDLLRTFAAAGRTAEGDAHLELAKRLLRGDGNSTSALERAWRSAKQLVRDASGREAPAAAIDGTASMEPRTRGLPVSDLPPELTSYIGREREEREIRARMSRSRLVTLAGPGGAGKTRLAVEIARQCLSDPLDEIRLLRLAALTDPLTVGEALSAGFGAQPADPGSAIDGATAHYRDKRALLILDNCEHLVDAIATLVSALLAGCPGLSILATSRERLGLPGESVYRVAGLDLPVASEPLTTAVALQAGAIRLFAERARATMPGFTLSDTNVAAVASICRQLDGLPMPLELAVPQLRMMQPQHLAAQLQDRMLNLGSGERGEPARRRTLTALFDWSYNLLDAAERALFRRLSVFGGTWSLAAAAEVAASRDQAAGQEASIVEVFELLTGLVDKSLVIPHLGDAEPRYGFLQTTRRYASAKLVESGEDDAQARLARHLADVCIEADASWHVTPTEQWRGIYEPELDNIRVALEWAFAPGGDARLGTELCAYSLRLWEDGALLTERERWFAVALTRSDATTIAPVLARLRMGELSNASHGDRANHAVALQAAEAFRAAEDPLGLGEALMKAGAAILLPDDTAAAREKLDAALTELAPQGPGKILAACLRSLAIAHYFVRDFEAARRLLSRSEAAARAVGDLRGVASVQIAAAELAFAAGATDEAIAGATFVLASRHCNPRQTVLAATNLVAYLLAADRIADARRAARRAIDGARTLAWRAGAVRLIEHLALVAALGRDMPAATRMLGHSMAFYASGRGSREFTEHASFDRVSALVAAALPADMVAELMAEGVAWSDRQALDQALAVARGPT